MKPKFIELKEVDCEHSTIINVEHILLFLPYKYGDHGLVTLVELTSKSDYFGGPLKVAETVEEIMQKIGG